jgi:hypothetical protein
MAQSPPAFLSIVGIWIEKGMGWSFPASSPRRSARLSNTSQPERDAGLHRDLGLRPPLLHPFPPDGGADPAGGAFRGQRVATRDGCLRNHPRDAAKTDARGRPGIADGPCRRQGAEIRAKFGPDIGWAQLQRILADRECVRYPCELVFDAGPLQPDECAYPEPKGAQPEDGYRLCVRET